MMWKWCVIILRKKNNMFTGIIQGATKILENEKHLVLAPQATLAKTKLGGSIAINGVCLTLVKRSAKGLWFEVMPETLRKTNLGGLKKNDLVNIEPALRVGDELGGHLVQGHVDGVGAVKKVIADDVNTLVEIEIPKKLNAYVVLHGSITLDGISLTIARVSSKTFTVSLITETLKRTIWKNISIGQKVNVEADVLGKYLKNFIKK